MKGVSGIGLLLEYIAFELGEGLSENLRSRSRYEAYLFRVLSLPLLQSLLEILDFVVFRALQRILDICSPFSKTTKSRSTKTLTCTEIHMISLEPLKIPALPTLSAWLHNRRISFILVLLYPAESVRGGCPTRKGRPSIEARRPSRIRR